MVDKTRIEINIVLPTVRDANDSCVRRLADLLRAKAGVESVHVTEGTARAEICIHYDPARLSLAEVRDLAKRAGAELDQRFGHLLVRSDAMAAGQARTAESRALQIRGVIEAAISPAGAVRIEFDRQLTDDAAVRAGLRRQGLSIEEAEATSPVAGPPEWPVEPASREHAHEHGGLLGERTELIFAAASGVLLLAGWLSSFGSVTPWLPWGLYLAAFFFGGFFTFREAITNILTGRFEIDSLMIVAAVGAAALGKWAEGALLLFLFSLGHALEHYAMGRAKRAIEALGELAPGRLLFAATVWRRKYPSSNSRSATS